MRVGISILSREIVTKIICFWLSTISVFLALLTVSCGAIAGTGHTSSTDDAIEALVTRPLFQKFTLFATVSIPLGEFGSADPNASGSGFAYPGAGAGMEYDRELFRHFGLGATGMFLVHGYDVSGWKNVIPYWHFEGDSRVVYALMAGPFYDIDLSPSVNIYGAGEIGMMHVSYPNLLLTDQLGEHATLSGSPENAAAYKLCVGATYKRFDADVQFMYGEPEFKATYEYRETQTHFLPEKLPVRSVMATFGYVLN